MCSCSKPVTGSVTAFTACSWPRASLQTWAPSGSAPPRSPCSTGGLGALAFSFGVDLEPGARRWWTCQNRCRMPMPQASRSRAAQAGDAVWLLRLDNLGDTLAYRASGIRLRRSTRAYPHGYTSNVCQIPLTIKGHSILVSRWQVSVRLGLRLIASAQLLSTNSGTQHTQGKTNGH